MNLRYKTTGLLSVLLGVMAASAYVWNPIDAPFGGDMKVTEAATEALEAARKMTEMLVTLATALIGGALFFFAKRGEYDVLTTTPERVLWILAVACAAFSLYWAFVAQEALLAMLEYGVFDPSSSGFVGCLRAQYLLFLASVVCLSLVTALHLDRPVVAIGGKK